MISIENEFQLRQLTKFECSSVAILTTKSKMKNWIWIWLNCNVAIPTTKSKMRNWIGFKCDVAILPDRLMISIENEFQLGQLTRFECSSVAIPTKQQQNGKTKAKMRKWTFHCRVTASLSPIILLNNCRICVKKVSNYRDDIHAAYSANSLLQFVTGEEETKLKNK